MATAECRRQIGSEKGGKSRLCLGDGAENWRWRMRRREGSTGRLGMTASCETHDDVSFDRPVD
jgi:hypothetical protein